MCSAFRSGAGFNYLSDVKFLSFVLGDNQCINSHCTEMIRLFHTYTHIHTNVYRDDVDEKETKKSIGILMDGVLCFMTHKKTNANLHFLHANLGKCYHFFSQEIK